MRPSELNPMMQSIARAMFPNLPRLPRVTTHTTGTIWGSFHAAMNVLSVHEQLIRNHPVSDTASTVTHELCHAVHWFERDHHGEAWRAEMDRVGLCPDTHFIRQFSPLHQWLVRR
jgi:predicted SprT family Zn-dependent metalloprotease